ncbi:MULTISPECIES: murein hydrolase activator EnvC family protein [Clostridium]|uniref:murein hydrolase activator EnvC family protein n=1 Tax=Clostridium TaxID=1485 RepID=UPI0008246BB3|nr:MULTISPECIES: M23 family metallopeptidase [Clostridium]PJI07124.1 M23 family peptidase [Clostridium sp. CT7]
MGNYNSQYENYYRALLNRNSRTSSVYRGDINKKNWGQKIVKKIEFQLVGAFILFVVALGCKSVTTPETKIACNYIKYTLAYNYDFSALISQVRDLDVSNIEAYANKVDVDSFKNDSVNYIEDLRTKITGGKTFADKIKQDYALPIEGKVISHYGAKGKNKGVDISASDNDNVKNIYNGTVENVGEDKDTGKYILVDNGDGIESKYSNIDSIEVKRGDGVTKGETIGKVKKSDDKSKAYLHFEIMYMGENKNPEDYFTFN